VVTIGWMFGPRKLSLQPLTELYVSRDVDGPVSTKARVIVLIFSFGKRARRFTLNFFLFFFFFVWVIGQTDNSFFLICSYCISCVLVRRATSFSFPVFFFFGKRGEARGNGPVDRGRRRRLASRTISAFAFSYSPFF
jgi:hypothetical protein